MKKKVTLYFPEPQSYFRPWKGVPLALLAISRVLARNDYEIKIISRFFSNNPEEEVLTECQDSICLGISAMVGFQIFDGLKISKLVKEKYPQLSIVWGGWHPSVLPLETARNRYVDIVVKGQGDWVFPELVDALGKRESLRKISGLVFKKDRKIIVNPDRPLEDINALPPLPYHLIDVDKCVQENKLGERQLTYSTSYGCPFRCGFCVDPIVNKRKWVGMRADRVVSDLEFLNKQYHVNQFMLTDNNFFVDEERVRNICSGIIKKGLKIKLADVNGRVRQLIRYCPETWELMRKSGLTSICTGAESGSQESLDLIQKDMNVEEIIKFTELCKKYQIKILFGFLVGLPWSKDPCENREFIKKEYVSTMVLINRLLKVNNKNRFTYYLYLPYPGSPLFKRAVNLGLSFPKTLEGWSNYLLSPEDAFKIVTRQRWITPRLARQVSMLSQYIFAVLDPETSKTIYQVSSTLKKIVFKFAYHLCLILVKTRWQLKFFSFPFDYWIFNLLRKKGQFT